MVPDARANRLPFEPEIESTGVETENCSRNPRKNALLKHGNKSDKIDARKLANLLRLNDLEPVYHGETGVRMLRELARSYLTIVKDLSRVMNRLKALYRSWAIPCAGRDVYYTRHRSEWLGKIPEAGTRRRAEQLYQQHTIVYLKNISRGKAMNLPAPRRSLDQKHCRYEPHILLMPQTAELAMKSSDAVLHTVHMDGAATYNLPFPFTDRVTTRIMNTQGVVNLRCNGGHVWMNAEMMVAPHPYYAVSDQNGSFELTDVPPGDYEVVAWHEGWHILGREKALDVFSQKAIQRAIFSEPRTWEQSVTVRAGETALANFVISEK